jgi:hypothetical protein
MNKRLGQGEASVYTAVIKKPTETVWREVLQHRMNRHTVGAYSVGVVLSENLNGYVTWKGNQMNRRLEKDIIGSSDAYFLRGR